MATSNVVERFMEALDSDPALLEAVRARLLTRELLELPERVERFAEATQRRFEALEAAQVETNRRLFKLESTLQKFMEVTTRQLDTLDWIPEHRLEMRVQGHIHWMGSRLRLWGVRALKAPFPPVMSPDFQHDVESAELDGAITEMQYVRLMETDLIARAHRGRDSEQVVYMAVEVAYRLDAWEVAKVVDSGIALALVFPRSEVVTIVHGEMISDQDRARAEEQGVEVILTSDSR